MNRFKVICILLLLSNNAFASLVSPLNGSNLNYTHVLFEWKQEDNAKSYNIQLSTNTSFANLVVNIDNESLMYIDTENINWNSSYNWRVRSKYND